MENKIDFASIDADFEKLNLQSEWLKAIANPIRLCILKGLCKKQACNVTYMQQCLSVPQSTLSQNIQILKSKGLIKGRRDKNSMYYSLADERVKKLVELLDEGEDDIE